MKTLMFAFVMLIVGDLAAQKQNSFFSSNIEQEELTRSQINLVKSISKAKSLDVHQFGIINSGILEEDKIAINILGKTYEYQKEEIQRSITSSEWRGREIDSNTSINLRNINGLIRGDFIINDKNYLIYPLSAQQNLYAILDVTEATNAYQECNAKHDHDHDQKEEYETGTTSKSSAGPYDCKVRLLVLFSDDVESDVGDNLQADIISAIAEVNSAYANSDISHQVELARIVGVTYNESHDNWNTALSVYDDAVVSLYRDKYEADATLFILSDSFGSSSSCGIAYVKAAAHKAFGVVKYGCMLTNRSFSHELAHIYGAHHNPEEDDNPFYDYGHGYNSCGDGNWRTIMSYSTTSGCGRENHFSNPDVDLPGTNDPTGTESTHDNARVLNQRAETVATFKQPKYTKIISDVLGGENDYAHIYAGYRVKSGTEYVVADGAKAIFQAPGEVELYSGFKVKAGGTFKALIQSCGSAITSIQSPDSELAMRSTDSDASEGLLNAQISNQLSISPNPTVSNAVIQLGLERESTVTITIMDLNGNKIKSILENAVLNQGNHMINANFGDIPNGIYLCSMQSDNFNKTVRIIVAK